MNEMKVYPIGKNETEDDAVKIVLEPQYNYMPDIDRVENPSTPAWCSRRPKSREESGCFDRAAEFNF